jgi:hypothetical protein
MRPDSGRCGHLSAAGRCLLLRVVVHTEAGQTWHVDIRVKTFVLEAANRLDFLRTEYGFAGPAVAPDETGVYPLLRRVRYNRSDLTLEISLVLSYMGEEYVDASLAAGDRSGSVRRTQIGSNTAHTGYQMRRALDRQAEAVRRILREQMPPGRD